MATPQTLGFQMLFEYRTMSPWRSLDTPKNNSFFPNIFFPLPLYLSFRISAAISPLLCITFCLSCHAGYSGIDDAFGSGGSGGRGARLLPAGSSSSMRAGRPSACAATEPRASIPALAERSPASLSNAGFFSILGYDTHDCCPKCLLNSDARASQGKLIFLTRWSTSLQGIIVSFVGLFCFPARLLFKGCEPPPEGGGRGWARGKVHSFLKLFWIFWAVLLDPLCHVSSAKYLCLAWILAVSPKNEGCPHVGFCTYPSRSVVFCFVSSASLWHHHRPKPVRHPDSKEGPRCMQNTVIWTDLNRS